ncbi:putative CC-NBS-LRR resistance protein, partial [Trifolium pratense]
MQTAEVLRLNQIKGEWRNLMPEIVPIDLGMDDLLELRLSCISQLQCLIDTDGSQVPTVLSKLTVLELNRMENLEELFKAKPLQSKDHQTAELPDVSLPLSTVHFSKPGETGDIEN